MPETHFIQVDKSLLGEGCDRTVEEMQIRSRVSLASFDEVISHYLDWKQKWLVQQLAFVNETLAAWFAAKDRQETANRHYGACFNPFARIAIKEIHHSRLVGDLLNPKGSHGQGDLFLQCFLDHLGIPNPSHGQWDITVETGRVDILLWREKPEECVIIIENKSNNAPDQLNQLYRYWHEQVYLWKPMKACDHDSCRIIYLPADGGKMPAPHSLERPSNWGESRNPNPKVPVGYDTLSLYELISIWMRKAYPLIPTTNIRLRSFLNQYQELWNP